MQNKHNFFFPFWESQLSGRGGGGGSDPIPTFIKHCFYGIFDPFLPKISEKFTEKIPTFGEGGGQAGWAKIPTFTENLFCMLP